MNKYFFKIRQVFNVLEPSNILLFLLIFLVSFQYSCKNNTPHQNSNPAFYHWQTDLQLTLFESQYLDSIKAQRLYVKFFDVDWDENTKAPVPLATVNIDTVFLNNLEIIPTVFITNRTLKNISENAIGPLAKNILQKINELKTSEIQEIQFDCDWTQSTKEKYFRLLSTIEALIADSQSLTATIRLHQFRYPEKTGVPPIDRGMLMFYNVGEVNEWETENSILDLAIADQYLSPGAKYPIPLDIALPLFRWGVVFREGKLTYLINNLNESKLQDAGYFFKIEPNRYEVLKSTYLQGYYLYRGDRLRLEKVDAEVLEQATDLLSRRFSNFYKPGNSDGRTIAFYHLDTALINSFNYKELKNVLAKFE